MYRTDPPGAGRGYAAAAARIVASNAIHTDSDGLVAGEVELRAPDRPIPAYRARPWSGRAWPIVVVVSEIFGVHEYIADVARRLAKRGYLAVAPEFFVRQGDAKATTDIDTLFATIVSKVPDAQALADIDAAVAFAEGEGGDGARLGITGFCWGGRMTWLYAAHNPKLKAGVAWYGRLASAVNALQTSNPIRAAAHLHAPVLGLYGEADAGIPLADVETMRQALGEGSDAARRSEIVVYPGAKHAFHADYRPNYDAGAAADGWRRCLDWLRAHGVA